MKLNIMKFGGRGASGSNNYKIPNRLLNKLKRRDDGNYYIANIKPTNFLKITSTDALINDIEEETKKYGKLDINKLNEGYAMLEVDLENGKVVSHEGRHRAQLLKNNNYKEMQIVIVSKEHNYNEKYAHDYGALNLKHQIDSERFKTTITNVKLLNKKK